MRYFKFVLTPLLAFFLGSFWVLHVNATSPSPLPTPDPFVIILRVVEGSSQLLDVSFTDFGLSPIGEMTDSFKASIDFGAFPLSDVVDWDSDAFTYTALTDAQKESLLSNPIYNMDGQLVSSTDSIFLVSYDNGFFHGNGYVDGNGNLLYSDSSLGGELLTLAIGGNKVNVTQFLDNVSDLSDVAYDNSFVLQSTNSSVPQAFTLYFGQRSYSGGRLDTAYISVPNIYDVGNTVALYGYNNKLYNGYCIEGILTNDLDSINLMQNGATANITDYGTSGISQDGYKYRYKITLPGTVIDSNKLGSDYDTVANNKNLTGYFVFYTNNPSFSYDSSIMGNNPYVAFKQLQFSDSATKVLQDPYEAFSLSDIQEIHTQLNGLEKQLNPDFDYSKAVNKDNNRYTYPVPSSVILNPSLITFPENNPSPDPSLNPDIVYDPSIQPEDSQITQSFANFGIPFIDNLFTRYPFSIPWDIKNLISSLVVTPEAPAWDFDYTISVLGSDYTHHFEGDLSDFDRLAQLFRNLVLISFTVTLAIFSYKNHF